MANYDSNYAIAQEISARIGVSPIPFDSVYSIALDIYNELGGEPAEFDSVYSILLGILPLVEGGVASKVIDDNVITTVKTWSSSKINSELSGKASIDYVDEQIEAVIGAGNSDIEGKETEDFTFVQTLPVEGEEGQQVIIKGDNTDTFYKYVSGEWVEQTPDATKLYFDTENEVLYSYATAEHQFVRISMVNTIVVGSNLNTNADLKAIKTVGVYNVVQRLHNATKGDYVKNWTLYVESVDYEEYDKSDSVYQRLVSNYTIQKRTWSATRATNDGWSNFSTYYAGEIKDTTTSKYYTWSSNKLSSELASKTNKADYVVGLLQASPGSMPELDLTPLNSATTDGIYSIIVKTDLITGVEESIGFGQMSVLHAENMGGAIVQGINITYNIEVTKNVIVSRACFDGTNWDNVKLDTAIIDDNKSFGAPWSTFSATKIEELLAAKQGTLTAGANISISGGTISATDTTYVAGSGITISGNSVSVDSSLLSEISGKQDELVAGTNITISGTTISATYEVATTADIEALFS